MTLQQREKALSLLKMAYVIQATVPGIPSIYYGDEVGMEGYKDPFNRLLFYRVKYGKGDKPHERPCPAFHP